MCIIQKDFLEATHMHIVLYLRIFFTFLPCLHKCIIIVNMQHIVISFTYLTIIILHSYL
ncbi:hypothetical protein Hanom_Chr09g00824071 [Helianthus anomalus]